MHPSTNVVQLLSLVALSTTCLLAAPKSHVLVRSAHAPGLHLELRGGAPLYTGGVTSTVPAPLAGLHPTSFPMMTPKEPTLLGTFPLDTEGPDTLGNCRPNDWSGLQTTIPSGAPPRTVGVPFVRF